MQANFMAAQYLLFLLFNSPFVAELCIETADDLLTLIYLKHLRIRSSYGIDLLTDCEEYLSIQCHLEALRTPQQYLTSHHNDLKDVILMQSQSTLSRLHTHPAKENLALNDIESPARMPWLLCFEAELQFPL